MCSYRKLGCTHTGVGIDLIDAGSVVLTGARETLIQLCFTAQPNKPTGTGAVVVIEEILWK